MVQIADRHALHSHHHGELKGRPAPSIDINQDECATQPIGTMILFESFVTGPRNERLLH